MCLRFPPVEKGGDFVDYCNKGLCLIHTKSMQVGQFSRAADLPEVTQ